MWLTMHMWINSLLYHGGKRMQIIYICIALGLSTGPILAQEQPFSRKDSAQFKLLQQHLLQAQNNHSFKEEADNLNKIGYLYWDHNQYAKAAAYYEQSMELNQKVGNENGMAMIANNLGMLYSDLGQYPRALQYFKETLAARRANRETRGIISALINISVVKGNLKEYNGAITDLEEALELARQENDLEQMRSCYGMLSETYQKAGNVKKSLYYFEYYRSFQELSQKKKLSNIEGALAEEREERENLETEKEQINTQLESKKGEIGQLSQKIAAADTILAQLHTELDSKNMQLLLVNQEKEILSLKSEREEKKLLSEQRKRRTTFLIAALLILFLLVVAGMIWYNRRRIALKNEQLEAQNASMALMNEELEASNRIKDTLFSVIGHDLRSPLGQLEQTFGMLDQDLLDQEEQELVFAQLRKGLKQGNLLLENLLAWAKGHMAGNTLRLTSFELNKVVEEGVFVLEGLYESKGVKLTKELHFKGTIEADADMVKLIVRNLTSNAIKFTPKDGEVSVETTQEGNCAKIAVKDKGVGMTQEQIAGLFDAKTNTSTFGTEKEKGTGIGLKLVKQFIDVLHGSIEINSWVGQGTTFTVRLPMESQS